MISYRQADLIPRLNQPLATIYITVEATGLVKHTTTLWVTYQTEDRMKKMAATKIAEEAFESLPEDIKSHYEQHRERNFYGNAHVLPIVSIHHVPSPETIIKHYVESFARHGLQPVGSPKKIEDNVTQAAEFKVTEANLES